MGNEKGYKVINYGKKAQRRNYSSMRYDIDLPDLIEIQTKSFHDFMNEGIAELLRDISPIEGQNGELKLYFEDHFLEESKYTMEEAKNRDMSYTKQLFANIKLVNVKEEGEIREARILMSELPYMSENATFIVNGAERVVVSQIIRSAGAYFSKEYDKRTNKIKYAAQVIPTRGAWLEFELGARDIMYAKLDRSRKIPITTLMRALGLSRNKDITELFGDSQYIKNSLVKDETRNSDDAIVELYKKLRQDDTVPANAAREFLRLRLFEPRRYDLAPVGRYKYNKKLDVTSRLMDTVIAEDIVDPNTGEIIVEKDTVVDKKIIKILKENRHALRTEVISSENSLQNEPEEEILAVRHPNGGDTLYAKDNFENLRTGEIIVEKDEEITDEVILRLQKKHQYLDSKVVKYFLEGKDVYEKESERTGVIVEQVVVYQVDEDAEITDKTKKIKILGNDQREERIHITLSDMIASLSYYLNLYEGLGSVDDIDHLGNRRLRLIGELLKNQFRIGLARTEKNIKDKMSTLSFADATPTSLVNMSPLSGAIKTFFGSSQLSQFMNQVNPLSELTQKRRVSALGTGGIARDRAGVEVRDVHSTHYGRICPIETPEGPSIGLISSLSTYGKVDQYGFIQTPYLVLDRSEVVNDRVQPKVTDKFDYLTADDEYDEIIASAASPLDKEGRFLEERVIGRYRGETNMYSRDQITYMDVSPKQIVSVATATIPFLEHDDATRALMGANMQRQAVPLVIPESPIVGTGIEYRAAKDSGAVIVTKQSGIVSYVDANKIVVTQEPDEIVKVGKTTIYDPKKPFDANQATMLRDYGMDESATYKLRIFDRSNQDTCILQKPLVVLGEFVEKGDIIADGASTENGELALGRNVTVAFMTWDGYNYEDAIIMSEDLVKDDVYTSIHIDQYETETRDIKAAGANVHEEITNEVPNAGAEALKNLDERGIIVVGSEVGEGDILVGKITPKGVQDPTPHERLIQSILGDKSRDFRDTSLRVPHGGGGVVQRVQYYSKANGDVLPSGINEAIRVFVAKKRKISEGDKMAGRHGNKGVISKILPREDMPHMADGTPVDIMLNPLGVPSRMNIGQVLEIHLGMAAKELGIKVATPVFDGVNDKELKAIMKEAGLDEDGKTVLYDGRTGEPFDNRISVGIMYMIKLSHMIEDKLHSRAVGPYTLVTQQPMGGKAQNGGQRFGEMEVWALYAYGAAHTLQEILTVKSDDMIGRNKVYSAITHGKPIPESSIPESFRVFTRELQALGLYVELIDQKTGENEAVKSLVDNTKRGGFR